MKTRYSSDQIYHRWAHQRDAHRITNGSSVHAEGACLFSYAECIGIITQDLTILSTYKWSVTTGKHQSYAHRAVSHHRTVSLPCHFPRDGSLARLADMARSEAASILRNIDHDNKARTINARIQSQLNDITALMDWARTVDGQEGAPVVLTLSDVRALRDGLLVQDHRARLDNQSGRCQLAITAAQNILKSESWHGIDYAIEQLRAMDNVVEILLLDYAGEQLTAPEYLGKLPAKARRLIPKLLAMCDARDAERLRINADKIARWHTGEDVYLSRELPPLLRIQGDQIATSWGACVPVSVAPILWDWVTAARATGRAIDGNGAPVGIYTLDSVNADGSITVGCHKIAYSELEGIAKQLKYI